MVCLRLLFRARGGLNIVEVSFELALQPLDLSFQPLDVCLVEGFLPSPFWALSRSWLAFVNSAWDFAIRERVVPTLVPTDDRQHDCSFERFTRDEESRLAECRTDSLENRTESLQSLLFRVCQRCDTNGVRPGTAHDRSSRCSGVVQWVVNRQRRFRNLC